MKAPIAIYLNKNRISIFINDAYSTETQNALIHYIDKTRYTKKDIPTKSMIECYFACEIIKELYYNTPAAVTLTADTITVISSISDEILTILPELSKGKIITDDSGFMTKANGVFIFIDNVLIENKPLKSYLSEELDMFIDDKYSYIDIESSPLYVTCFNQTVFDLLNNKSSKIPNQLDLGLGFHKDILSYRGITHMFLPQTNELFNTFKIKESTSIEDGISIELNSDNNKLKTLINILNKNNIIIQK